MDKRDEWFRPNPVPLTTPSEEIDLINGKGTEGIVVAPAGELGTYSYHVTDSTGTLVSEGVLRIDTNPFKLPVPVSGLIQLKRAVEEPSD